MIKFDKTHIKLIDAFFCRSEKYDKHALQLLGFPREKEKPC